MKHAAVSVLVVGLGTTCGSLVVCVPGVAAAWAPVQGPSFPATPAGRCAQAFVGVLNDKGEDSIRAFEAEFRADARRREVPVEQRIPRIKGVRGDLSPLTVTKVLDGDEVVVFATTGSGEETALVFQMSTEQPEKMDGVLIMPADEYHPSTPVNAASRAEIVGAVCDVLEKEYVYPEVAKQMTDHARARLKAGAYDAFNSESRLAAAISSDLRSISHDKHLDVRLTPQPLPPPAARAEEHMDDAPSPEVDARFAKDNYAFREVKRLEGNIGYLKFNMFLMTDGARQTAAAAMTFLSHCDALIVDLRDNGGGEPGMISFLTSYLFDSRTHLNDMVDRQGKIVEEYWTLDTVPGQRLRAGTPVYILTSSSTFSGAEEFCYNLQNLERATIIGETTGGGAHPVKLVGARGNVAVRVPFMRACNPVSKKNWEGVGVVPDIATTREAALDRALDEARKAITNQAPRAIGR